MNRRNLTLEFRPRRLSELIGQDQIVADLRNAFQSGNRPAGLTLTGSFGQGKTTIARILGLAFNCEHQEVFGEPCDACLANENLFNILERNCADLTTKDEMSSLMNDILAYPNFGRWRVVILDELQQASDKAQQVILKPLEKKESVNIFINCTSDPNKINKAVLDRCKPYSIPEMTHSGVATLAHATALRAQTEFGMEARDMAPLLRALKSARITSGRNVVMAVEQYLEGMRPEQAIVVLQGGEVDYYAVFKFVEQGNWEEARACLAKAKPTDGPELKTRAAGHFRDHLLKSKLGPRADLLSSFIRELATNNIVEYGLQLSATIATLYRICQVVTDIKSNGSKPITLSAPGFSTTIQ